MKILQLYSYFVGSKSGQIINRIKYGILPCREEKNDWIAVITDEVKIQGMRNESKVKGGKDPTICQTITRCVFEISTPR